MTLVCVLCGASVDPRDAFQRVQGWERKAIAVSRKGGSDIVLRESRDEFACPSCIALKRSGIHVGQETLV